MEQRKGGMGSERADRQWCTSKDVPARLGLALWEDERGYAK